MKFSAVGVLLALILSLWVGEGNCSGSFDWEPFRAEIPSFRSPDRESVGSDIMKDFKDINQYQFSFNDRSDQLKDQTSDSRGLEFDFRHFKFSISRYAFDLERDHTLRSFDIDKQKRNLVDSLPSTLQGSSFQHQFETVGKIFEPKINLQIEF